MVSNTDFKFKRQSAQNTLLMIGMFSIIMLFAGLTSAYIVSKGALGVKWDYIVLPNMFYYSTVMILASSMFGHFSVKFCKSDNSNMLKRFLSLTILCGLLFFVFQILGWKDLVDNGKFLSGNNVASSYLYVLTLTHFVHVVGGVVALLVIFFQSINNQYNAHNFHGLQLGIRFWHFLAGLWIYLFLFLVLIN
ncbi:MAG: cytochrome oxidase subunit III [Flavobacteriales bacterium]|nr:cytochrome oxidase subunit III [Flavobacteriales bacterium]|tara:strand:- start:251 stop:826 length:576 start_codon:yes stop_codon:yes gene_type:complete